MTKNQLTSTVGLPLESNISLALTPDMADICRQVLFVDDAKAFRPKATLGVVRADPEKNAVDVPGAREIWGRN